MVDKLKRYTPFLLFAFSAIYYILLSAKNYTWLFASGDSGDWLTASKLWIVPQPYGSPLYIALGHTINAILPTHLAQNMTVLLSCIPAAITVTIVYLITLHITKNYKQSLFASAIVLAASIFLTQATILEEYSLAVMFVTAAYYFYLKDRKYLAAAMLGLGTAVHILPLLLAMLWLLVERKQIKQWFKPILLYILLGIAPYTFILYLFTTDAPPLIAGYGLSFEAINSYLGSTKVFGSLPVLNLPERLLQFTALVIMSLGLTIVPIKLAFKKPFEQYQKLLLVGIFLPTWYYFTCLDPSTWTFMTYAVPFAAIAAGIGIAKINEKHVPAYAACIALLFLTNTLTLNANELAAKEPNAQIVFDEVSQLPDNSILVTYRGGFEAMASFYAYAEGKDIIHVFTTDENYEKDALYQNHLKYLSDKYDLQGENTRQIVSDALNKGYEIYTLWPLLNLWNGVFDIQDINLTHYKKVTGVNLNETN